MKKIIVCVVIISGFSFGYMTVNEIVGKVIDAEEAQYYRIFSDVPGFETARFMENTDSILIEINTEINGTHETQYRNVDTAIYTSLDYYIKYFKRIIEDPEYRQRYIKKHVIGWPIVSQGEIDEITPALQDKKNLKTMNCMGCITSGSAYIGALLGRKIVGSSECIAYYTINPWIFGYVTAAGTMTGCLITSNMDRSKIKNEVLKKDILAFDPYQQPITIQDYQKEENTNHQCLYSSAGLLVGLVASTTTLAILAIPYVLTGPRTDWDAIMTVVPIIGFSISELATIVHFSSELGHKDDLKATIEKIKQKRIKEHLEKTKR